MIQDRTQIVFNLNSDNEDDYSNSKFNSIKKIQVKNKDANGSPGKKIFFEKSSSNSKVVGDHGAKSTKDVLDSSQTKPNISISDSTNKEGSPFESLKKLEEESWSNNKKKMNFPEKV